MLMVMRFLQVLEKLALVSGVHMAKSKYIEGAGLPAYRLGRLWKFRKKDVDRWLKKND